MYGLIKLFFSYFLFNIMQYPFSSFKERDAIIRAARTVKPRGVYVSEDYSQRVITRRKELLPQVKEARERGKVAYMSFDKLVVKDKLVG